MDTKRVRVNGIDFVYLEEGEGPLVLCLHGFPDHAPTFAPLLRALAGAGYRGVAPWMRGYPPTGRAPDGRYHTPYLALDALALTDVLAGEGDAYLVGSDWGAGAAYLAIAARPDRFRKAVTMAVPPQEAIGAAFLQSPAQWKRSWYIWFFGTPLADVAFPAGDFAIVDVLWADWSPGYRPDLDFIRALKDVFRTDGGQAAMGYYRDSFHGRQAPGPEVAHLTGGAVPIPVLYFHGTSDGCLGIELLDEAVLAGCLGPGGEFVRIEGAGHFLHLERTDEVARRIIEFFGS